MGELKSVKIKFHKGGTEGKKEKVAKKMIAKTLDSVHTKKPSTAGGYHSPSGKLEKKLAF